MSAQENRPTPAAFGRYTDPVLLGQGGMGAVYRATDPMLDRFVAVKVLTHREPKYVERFRREAQVLAKIMHPCIIQIYEIVGSDEEQQDPYIVMEYFEGKPLDSLLKMGPMHAKDLVSVIRQTAESTLFFPEMEPLREELAHFVDCINTRKTPRTDGENGLRVLRVLDACQRSIQADGQPVRL